jgi:hypothetical protein
LNTLGDGANKFNGLSDKQKACFLNITAALQWAGIKTDMQKRLSSDSSGWGIQEDRLMFAAPIGNLEEQVRAAIKNRSRRGDKGFVSDKPLKSEHKGMNYWGARQWVTTTAIQIGEVRKARSSDIDEFGARTDVVGFFGIPTRVLRNKIKRRTTDPFKVGKQLRDRGIVTMYE